MTATPTPVCLGIIRDQDDRLLLVQRERGDFIGYWGLPGGKIETDEHLRQAIEREIHEETGLTATMDSYLGLVSEHVHLTRGSKHVLIHICSCTVTETDTTDRTDWFTRDQIDSLQTVPSLAPILDHIHDSSYIESVIEETDDSATVKEFITTGHRD